MPHPRRPVLSASLAAVAVVLIVGLVASPAPAPSPSDGVVETLLELEVAIDSALDSCRISTSARDEVRYRHGPAMPAPLVDAEGRPAALTCGGMIVCLGRAVDPITRPDDGRRIEALDSETVELVLPYRFEELQDDRIAPCRVDRSFADGVLTLRAAVPGRACVAKPPRWESVGGPRIEFTHLCLQTARAGAPTVAELRAGQGRHHGER